MDMLTTRGRGQYDCYIHLADAKAMAVVVSHYPNSDLSLVGHHYSISYSHSSLL